MASFEKRGKKWRAIVSAVEGTKRVKKSKTFDTKREATEWSFRVENNKMDGLSLGRTKETLTNWFNEWYTNYREPYIRDSTKRLYEVDKNRIKLIFGDVKVKELTTIFLQQKMNDFAKEHSKQTTSQFWRKITASLRDAQIDGLIIKDVWSRVKIINSVQPTTARVLSASEFQTLQSYLYNNLVDYRDVVILIALETGARSGEITALTKDDIDFTNNAIIINKSYSSNTRQLSATKNEQSNRTVYVNKSLLEAIKPFLKDMPFYNNSYSELFLRHLRSTLNALNIAPIRFHDLRHSHASFLLYNDVSIEYVSKRLGHKNTRVTLDVYAHLLKEKEQSQRELALNFLNVKSPNVPK
ncbi:site-specific integrase [Leuconostoc gasicomitatum]|uniref:site-specific integrase n=1 Tax=Leuconostoc gasicomitatum TaxID=115778 RepID=UPI001CC66132|nr:site-specific integrase [Leuconostoc gasicomitatum]MBZ5968885.1 site-specific integrase [Leuconostoc gasicomitatum]